MTVGQRSHDRCRERVANQEDRGQPADLGIADMEFGLDERLNCVKNRPVNVIEQVKGSQQCQRRSRIELLRHVGNITAAIADKSAVREPEYPGVVNLTSQESKETNYQHSTR